MLPDPLVRAPGTGLVHVSTDALTTLLRAVYRGDLACPFDIADLTRVGLQYCAADLLGHFRELDEAGVRAVVVAVVAERRVMEERFTQRLAATQRS
jgi:hypothetical protein